MRKEFNMEKILKVLNPNNLPTMPYTDMVEFQGDLKKDITSFDLIKIKNSLKKHGVFLPKFVWFDDEGVPNIVDGHQTKIALTSLEQDDGWEIPEIPYVKIGAENRLDAAEKLLQINSRYATMNSETTWFHDIGFPDVEQLMTTFTIPEFAGFSSSQFGNVFGAVNDNEHPVEFPEYDESVADGVEICTCPTCGHEHVKTTIKDTTL
jgi:hypothetical protein